MADPTDSARAARRPGPVRRILGALVDLLPSGPAEPDPILSDLENLTPAEREERYRIAGLQERRGRGDGSMG